MNYFDTSALLKYFIEEKDSEQIQKTIQQDSNIFTSIIAYPEIYSALNRKLREKLISSQSFAKISKIFEECWLSYHKVKLKNEILILSRDLIRRYPLRAFDAIHLASAFQLGDPKEITLLAADGKLVQAAIQEGFKILS